MNRKFDVIVVGVGAMGGAACLQLARRGLRVLGLEQFGIGHDRGSSHGETRIIRKAYFEHPDYVPLLHRAYELWEELERAARMTLFVRTGLMLAGPTEGIVVPGVLRSAQVHGLEIERLSTEEARGRFGAFRFDDSDDVLFERDAGYLRVEDCVRAQAQMARAAGATLLENCAVLNWHVGASDGRGMHGTGASCDHVRVETDDGVFLARKLVICGGAWAGNLLCDIGLPFTVRRKVQCWFGMTEPRVWAGAPIFGFEAKGGFYYGFPPSARGTSGGVCEDGTSNAGNNAAGGLVKVANHSGGEAVSRPEQLDRTLRTEDASDVAAFVSRRLVGVEPVVQRHSVCMYTMTPDEHFVIDRHPRHENVLFAAGFSGHGFKFAPVIGEVLADLAVEGRTRLPGGFLSAGRFRAKV